MEWGEVENGMGRRSGKWNGEEWKMEWGGGVENGMGRSGKWNGEEEWKME